MAQRAFTFPELLVVIAVIAALAALLLLAAARTRADGPKAVCAANLGQLGAAITRFADDHSGMFPPAGDEAHEASGVVDQISWDTYVNFYITGRRLATNELKTVTQHGVIPRSQSPGALLCPADTGPDKDWVANYEQDPPHLPGRRTYAMNSAGINWGTQYSMSAADGYVLPRIGTPGQHGVGIYWINDTTSGWNAPGYKMSVVVQPAGTILLVEEPCGNNVAANIWPCISLGPFTTDAGTGNGEMYQIAPNDPNNEGAALYSRHGNHFNYLFHDDHVSALTLEQTVGSGTTNLPLGMWTITQPNGNH
ncbi:MAG: prepilin-type N-terminal cleavage/methylation domain-containing protein [Limisphaerales bacterium]